MISIWSHTGGRSGWREKPGGENNVWMSELSLREWEGVNCFYPIILENEWKIMLGVLPRVHQTLHAYWKNMITSLKKEISSHNSTSLILSYITIFVCVLLLLVMQLHINLNVIASTRLTAFCILDIYYFSTLTESLVKKVTDSESVCSTECLDPAPTNSVNLTTLCNFSALQFPYQ